MCSSWIGSRNPDHGNAASLLAPGLGDLIHCRSVSPCVIKNCTFCRGMIYSNAALLFILFLLYNIIKLIALIGTYFGMAHI